METTIKLSPAIEPSVLVESASKAKQNLQPLKISVETAPKSVNIDSVLQKTDNVKSTDDIAVLKKAESAINELVLSKLNQKMTFEVDEKTDRTIIKIVDKQTNEVIKQIPAQEYLDMVYNLNKAAAIIFKDFPKYV